MSCGKRGSLTGLNCCRSLLCKSAGTAYALPRFSRQYATDFSSEPRESDNVDLCIVGGGPAGLAAAIRFKQLDKEHGSSRRVVILEKAADMGGHIVSGAVIEPHALDELIPNWRSDMPETCTPVGSESMVLLTANRAFNLPIPPSLKNECNYVVSLSTYVRWLSNKAEELGVEVYPGVSVSELLYDEQGKVEGVATSDLGLDNLGKPTPNFTRGMNFYAPLTLLAEGCRGSLTKQVVKRFDLDKNCCPQTYGLGVKEVWEILPEKFRKGHVCHALGWPLFNRAYGGGFLYHFAENLVSIGLVTGLDYRNPYFSPYEEFQRMKHHPYFANVLEGGRCISYGARALSEGGYQSIPKLTFPGGGLVGCSAGFMNVAKLKGSHTAMKSGMLAAEAAYAALKNGTPFEFFEKSLRDSWVGKELHAVRNIRPSFNSPLKLWGGVMYSAIQSFVLRGREPWTFKHSETDAAATGVAEKYSKIEYPRPDNRLSFDILTSVSRTGTYHRDDEPCHLRVPDQDLEKHARLSWPNYKGVEERFCPAGVYEFIPNNEDPNGIPTFRINSQNCIHCKTCDIKVPTQDITWTVPEGGDGPKYSVT